MDKLVAEYSTATPPANPTINYTATDQLGSPRVITNSFGDVVSRRDFMPFGEELYADGIYRKTGDHYSTTGQDAVCQRFTGYQHDTETSLDFAEARMYNNQHGRFTAVDPLLASGKSADPRSFNRYVYVLNNPLLLVDRTGAFPEFTFSVYVRSFAPYSWFGPGDVAMGDGRGFSVDPNASYRIQAYSEVTTTDDNKQFPMTMTRASEPTLSVTNLGNLGYSFNGIPLMWSARSACYINDPTGNYHPDGLQGDDDSLSYHMYGHDAAIPGSRDIDLHPEFKFNYTPGENGNVDMQVTGTVTGDQFPAAEAFIRDSKGNSVMLGVFAPSAGSGPVTSLPRDRVLPMMNVNVTVRVNNGVFQGIVEDGNVVSIGEYNKRFLQQPAVK